MQVVCKAQSKAKLIDLRSKCIKANNSHNMN